MSTNTTTTYRSYPLPYPSNLLAVDVLRLRDALIAIDADMNRHLGESEISLGTQQATTSGTFKDFTAIPSWARQITVAFSSVSTNGTADILVQLGTGATPTTSGYSGQSAFSWSGGTGTTTSAAGIPVFNNDPGFLHFGHLTLLNVNGNDWLASGHFATGGSFQGATVSSGVIQLSGVLENLRVVTANGTDAFDAGSVNIAWQ